MLSTVNKRWSSVLCVLLLALLCLFTVSCKTETDADNSPGSYEINGSLGETSYDTSKLPVFSHAPGIYSDAITVCLTCQNETYTIRYTTDCSVPTLESHAYTEPFAMSYRDDGSAESGVSVFNLRAACFDQAGNMIGRTVSASYLFPKESDRFSTKVISIVSDPASLYGPTGILDNPYNRGKAWERAVNFQLYHPDGSLIFRQDLGMRIDGTDSRYELQKSFRLFARKEYTAETGRINYPLFPGLSSEFTKTQIEEYNTLILRGGSSDPGNTVIANQVAYELLSSSSVSSAAFEPAVLFLNGEYYGIMMLMEDYSPHYFESHYGVDQNKIATIDFSAKGTKTPRWQVDNGIDAELTEWNAVRAYIKTTNMSFPGVYEKAASYIDTENFIDYIIAECYLNNIDWPDDNIRVWRYTGAKGKNASALALAGGYDASAEFGFDGKWRYLVKDYDASQGIPSGANSSDISADFFALMKKTPRLSDDTYDMFVNLMRSARFSEQFYRSVCEFVSGCAATDNYLDVINTQALQISAEMPMHLNRFSGTLTGWDKRVQIIRSFAEQRASYVIEDVNEYAANNSLSYRLLPLTVSVGTGGSVSYCDRNLTGNCSVYTVRGLEMELTVKPSPGYTLDKIEVVGGTYQNGRLCPDTAASSVSLTVSFRKLPEGAIEPPTASDLVINEIGHSSLEHISGYDWVELYNPTSKDINLKGYSISDGISSYTFPKIIVPAGGFKVIFCSETLEGGVYAPFAIAKGEVVSLLNNKGKMADHIQILPTVSKTHLGRYPDGGEWVELSRFEITPNAENKHLAKHTPYYGEQVCNTVLIDGKLCDPAAFTCSEDGVLLVTKPQLLDPKLKEILALTKGPENENLKTWYRKNKEALKAKGIKVYYVDSLNTYIIHC